MTRESLANLGQRRVRHMQLLVACGFLIGTAGSSPPDVQQAGLTQAEALRLAFPEPATIERRTAFLEDEDLERIRQLAGGEVRVDQRVLTFYVATDGDEVIGAAYFDAHRVRTLPEVLMIVVTSDERIGRIEVLKFSEPPEYRAPDGWLRQFEGEGLTERLSLKGAIVNITGASLTSQAVTRATRRVLAYHRFIQPFNEADPRGPR